MGNLCCIGGDCRGYIETKRLLGLNHVDAMYKTHRDIVIRYKDDVLVSQSIDYSLDWVEVDTVGGIIVNIVGWS
jgi:hypothetical protein